MFHLPYLKGYLGTPEGRNQLAGKIVKYYAKDTDKGVELINKMTKAFISANYNLGIILNRHEESRDSEVKAKLAEQHRELSETVSRVKSLMTCVKVELAAQEDLMGWLVLRVRFDKSLAGESLSNLRLIVQTIQGRDNEDELMDWLHEEVSIFLCPDCEEYEYCNQSTDVYGREGVCRRCIDHYYTYSSYYNQHVHNEDGRYALSATNEEVFIHSDDDDFAYNDDQDQLVHCDWLPPTPPVISSYHSSKGSFLLKIDDWARENGLFFGAELEVEVREGDRNQKASLLNDKINGGELGKNVFFENDGSLSHGFEIISQPMSLPAHRELWQWTQDRNATKGLRSHQTTTCGLHVHVSRAEMTGMQIAKIVAFVNDPDNKDLIMAIARRYESGYCKIKTKKIDDNLEILESSDRYDAVNITPRRTIEMRIFKGTLNYDGIVAALEFTNALCMFTKGNKFQPEHLKSDRFLDFISNGMERDTDTLRSYLGQRMGMSFSGQETIEAAAESAVTA